MQQLIKTEQFIPFPFHQFRHGNAGPFRDDLCDLLLRDAVSQEMRFGFILLRFLLFLLQFRL